jgi:hypothetical protein
MKILIYVFLMFFLKSHAATFMRQRQALDFTPAYNKVIYWPQQKGRLIGGSYYSKGANRFWSGSNQQPKPSIGLRHKNKQQIFMVKLFSSQREEVTHQNDLKKNWEALIKNQKVSDHVEKRLERFEKQEQKSEKHAGDVVSAL